MTRRTWGPPIETPAFPANQLRFLALTSRRLSSFPSLFFLTDVFFWRRIISLLESEALAWCNFFLCTTSGIRVVGLKRRLLQRHYAKQDSPLRATTLVYQPINKHAALRFYYHQASWCTCNPLGSIAQSSHLSVVTSHRPGESNSDGACFQTQSTECYSTISWIFVSYHVGRGGKKW
jgi:hypothetical protein